MSRSPATAASPRSASRPQAAARQGAARATLAVSEGAGAASPGLMASLSLFSDLAAATGRLRRTRQGSADWGDPVALGSEPAAAVHSTAVPAPKRRERPWPAPLEPVTEAATAVAARALPAAAHAIVEETCQTLLRANDAPDVPCAMAVNPYRLSDPDTANGSAASQPTVHAKVNAAERLRAALSRPGYVARPIHLGSITDAYHPVEQQLRLTRQLVELLHGCGHPFALCTRSAGVQRDLDWLADLATRRQVLVLVSLAGVDAESERAADPDSPAWASSPEQRLQTIKRLARAGIWVGLNLTAAALPADPAALDRLVAAAAAAGARSLHWRPRSQSAEAGANAPWRAHVAPHLARWAGEQGLSLTLPELDTHAFVPPPPLPVDRPAVRPQRELF